MASMTPGEDNPFGGPFDEPAPPGKATPGAGGDKDASGGGFLDDLRDSGEDAVNSELAGLQQAMSRVQSFTQTVADADVDALRSEWAQIETEIKRALQQGLSAVEERTVVRQQAHVDVEVKSLASEVTRKNELITQLSDTVKKLNNELDEKDRRLRDEGRALRDRLGAAEEELIVLRARTAEHEQVRSKLAQSLDVASSDVEELRQRATSATEALALEKAQQEERFAALNQELNEAHLANSRLEAEKREADRKCADAERRLQASERAREKAEAERNERTQEASRAAKEARTATERVAALEAELATARERLDKDVRRLKRLEGRLRADGETFRSRVGDAMNALETAAALLKDLPRDPPADEDAAAAEPTGT